MTEFELKFVCSQFDIDTKIQTYGNGHINDTYVCESSPRFILQKINTNVFKDADSVMNNIYNVTKHLKNKIIQNGGDPDRETLTLILTKDQNTYYKSDSGYFRMYGFVENSKTIEFAEDPVSLYYAARAFGKFQKMLSDFPADTLAETIEDFHNTPVRVQQLQSAIANNAAGRKDVVMPEIDFALEYAKYASSITDAMKTGDVPLRVTHNDTKLNNVLFDNETGEELCVIDLDTVMPGSLLYDFGDALRFGASSGAEDETDLDKIWFDLAKFEYFAKGFLEEMSGVCTSKEIELMPLSVLLMTYECGIRFLADYLNGDVYFKIHRPDHNLDRARTQFKLVADIEKNLNNMTQIIKKYCV